MSRGRASRRAAAALAISLAGCGGGSAPTSTRTQTTAVPTPAAVATTVAPGSATGTFTTLDGARYRVTVTVGPRPSTGVTPDCATGTRAGATAMPVKVTVANEAPDRAAPFPAVRVELVHGSDPPVPVPVKSASGACTFTPRVSEVGAGVTVSFQGATPPIDDRAGPGSAGRVQVSVSESTFSVSTPAP